MFSRLIAAWSTPAKPRALQAALLRRRLQMQQLESRAMMTAVPALSSLPGAPHALYLDFDGDFQSVWNRTDSGQTYRNVSVGEFNLDNTPGFSAVELTAINKIWQTVAEDYAPFNINVTTVQPFTFGDLAIAKGSVAAKVNPNLNAFPFGNVDFTRVVMCGSTSAQLQLSSDEFVNLQGDRFVTNDGGHTLLDTSGYSAVGSFTNSEPNVVYVFSKYINTWGTTDSEGRSRDMQYIMATTASHEAGHSFGLVHDGDYDVGTNITTPIMGSNTQGDRSLWASYGLHDNLQELTSLLGARSDDFSDTYSGASTFQFTNYSPIRGSSGSVKGIVSSSNDSDWFRLNSTGGTYSIDVKTLPFGNLDSRLEVYRIYESSFFTIRKLVGASDPSIPSTNPFAGLGSHLNLNLAAGTYAVVVKSHGGYGDLGNYTLGINKPELIFVNPNIGVLATVATTSPPAPTGPTSVQFVAFAASGGQGQWTTTPAKKHSSSADEVFAAWN